MAIVTKKSRPLAVSVFSATPFESTLLEQTIGERFKGTKISRLVGGKAYDSDPLDKWLKQKDIELIAPHKCNREENTGWKALRHYSHRWTVKRFFSWLHNF